MSQYYRQCELTRKNTKEVVWIPEEFAKIGKILRIKTDEGWRVAAIYGRESEDYLLEHERDYINAFPSLA